MKKIKFFIIVLFSLFITSGCNVYLYNFDNNNTTDSSNKDDSTNLGDNNSGSTIVTPETNYAGFIKYASSLPLGNNNWEKIYNEVKTTVVTIRNIVGNKTTSTGSGVFFAQDSVSNGYAYIFTNAHVVEGSTSIEVLLHNNIMVKGTLIGYDKNEDVAVVKIEKRNDINIATLRHTNTLNIGEKVMAVGSPLGEKYSSTATNGIISNLNITISPDDSSLDLFLIQVDAALNPGNSGGPLFDNNGNLIGINTIKLVNSGSSTNIESFNYAIPISHFELVASYLLQGSLYYRPFLNISVMDIRMMNTSERNNYNLQVDTGLLILEIGSNSPLKNKANVNQVITHIEGVKVNKSSDFCVELLKYAPNEKIHLTICNANGTNQSTIETTLIKR